MPGTPGPRPTGGDTDVSDGTRPLRGGTPYRPGENLPMYATTTVGGSPYLATTNPRLRRQP